MISYNAMFVNRKFGVKRNIYFDWLNKTNKQKYIIYWKELYLMFTVSTPRLRTIREAACEIKSIDPNTAVTPYRIRQLILNGILPSVRAGNKYLLNLDLLLEYLNEPTADKFRQAETKEEIGKIRSIQDRRTLRWKK